VEETWEFAALVFMGSRPKIPAAMQRTIKEEAGYRCAVPTCRDVGPFDFEHINPWAEVQKHEEHNIILLCVRCHARVTRGEIHKDAIKAYKRNLAIISGRYSLFEMRVLENYRHPVAQVSGEEVTLEPEGFLFINDHEKLHISGLLKDKLVKLDEIEQPTLKRLEKARGEDYVRDLIINVNKLVSGRPRYHVFPTKYGVEFVAKYFGGEEIE